MLEQLEEVSKPKKRGAKPSFTPIDIILLIRTVGIHGLISRAKLSEELGIGEGAIRTMIRYLKSLNVIKVIRSGISLDKKGQEIFKTLANSISFESFFDEKKLNGLALSKYNYLIVLKNKANKIKKGIEERDIAIRFGTKALISLIYKDKDIKFPDGFQLGEEYSSFKRFLMEMIKLEENDVILISCSDEKISAIKGAYSVLYHLLK